MIEIYSPTIRRKEMDAVLTVMVEEKIGPGEQAARLVQFAKEALNFEFSQALRSPAFALSHALKLLALEKGSGILVSALSPEYYHKVILDLDYKPIVCDTAGDSPCPTAETIKAAIGRSAASNPARAMALYHSLGFLPDTEVFSGTELPIIEDISAAFGSSLNEKKAGSFGLFTILGLEERDVLTAGGGALLYAAEKRNAAVLRNSGAVSDVYSLADMNAAMAIVQIRESARNMEKRREYAGLYTQNALQQGRHKLFAHPENFENNNYAFALVLETGMKDVIAWARRKEIVVESAFEKTLVGAGLVEKELCPQAYSLSLRTALFPVYPRLGGAGAAKVARLIQTLP
ncbi:aminotransferase [Spirochaetia bacterium]|nr:aminotransferase [Spirochaetia bacterium]